MSISDIYIRTNAIFLLGFFSGWVDTFFFFCFSFQVESTHFIYYTHCIHYYVLFFKVFKKKLERKEDRNRERKRRLTETEMTAGREFLVRDSIRGHRWGFPEPFSWSTADNQHSGWVNSWLGLAGSRLIFGIGVRTRPDIWRGTSSWDGLASLGSTHCQ